MSESLDLEHKFVDGADDTSPVLLLLHGTGGGQDDLVELAHTLSPTAALLAPSGPVSEHGMARWFRRRAEGVFDYADVRRRADQLAAFILAARTAYDLADRRLLAVGFSNGANIAAATVLLRPDALREAVLFAAMLPVPDPPQHDLTGSRVLLCNGRSDPMAPVDSAIELVRLLSERSVEVTQRWHHGGHGITEDGVAEAKKWLSG
ncbi:MAG: alpha/beta hydrolase [Sciscionella sp.]|nr:alpha/beta hydrolase [Sciscionella sp.]